MKFLNGLVLGIIFGAAGFWFFQYKAGQHPESEQRYEQSAAQAATAAGEAARHLSDALAAKLETLDLRRDEIKDEDGAHGRGFVPPQSAGPGPTGGR